MYARLCSKLQNINQLKKSLVDNFYNAFIQMNFMYTSMVILIYKQIWNLSQNSE